MITVLAGGVGAARFLAGLVQVVDPAEITVIVNTGDDIDVHGLHISPDLDTITYTLAGAINPETGWGLGGETWQAMASLARFVEVRPAGSTAANTWFNLGDRDLATHLYRSHRLGEGAPLSTVTAEITRAWGLGLRLLPMTDDVVETRVTTAEGELGFQEYFVGRRHSVAVSAVRFVGSGEARPAPGVLAALNDATTIVIAPSNPLVSIGPLLSIDGIADVLRQRRRSVVAISPIVAGAALKGPADRMLTELGHEASVVGVARLYRDLAATLVIDVADAEAAGAVAEAGTVVAVPMRTVVTPTIMSSPVVSAALARTVIAAAGQAAAEGDQP